MHFERCTHVTSLLDYLKWDEFGVAPEIWMGIVLTAVLVIAALMNFTRRDIAYTAVILWALAGISVKHAAVPAVALPTWITFGLVALTLAAAATGLLALIKPDATYGFIGLTANSVRGVSEIRSIFGGIFIALGLAPLFLGPVAYQMLGITYLAIAAARAFSIVFDKSYAQSNLISLVIEILLGAGTNPRRVG
ncbi:MAG: hypothetical protein EHM81_05905 [Chloroflexi bacterium]|nr:MAG: hypothetical protein EHM81_05905 [Chloroflexota bacterium]